MYPARNCIGCVQMRCEIVLIYSFNKYVIKNKILLNQYSLIKLPKRKSRLCRLTKYVSRVKAYFFVLISIANFLLYRKLCYTSFPNG